MFASAQSSAPPFYSDKKNLLVYLDGKGKEVPIRSAGDWQKRRDHILASMQLVMGPLPDASRKVPLDIQVLEEVEFPAFTRRKLTYASEAGDAVPAYLLIPRNLKHKAPALICPHPTHPLGKRRILEGDRSENRCYALELAERGYVTLAPDYPGFGDYPNEAYARGYVSATMKGIWNHMRGVDLLQALPEVDGKRIGSIGHSLGGHNAMFLAIFDPRVKAIVSSGGFNSFFKYKGGDLTGWSHKGYMPRIATEYGKDPARMPFDFTEIVAALAPRPFFFSAPIMDEIMDAAGAQDCFVAALPIYELFGAREKLVAEFPNCPHDFPPDVRRRSYEFLDRALAVSLSNRLR